MATGPVDRARWQVLSPLLDTLLDLPAPERAARLAALWADDPGLAADLAPWLDELAGLDDSSFLQAPALPPPPGLAGRIVGAYTLVREIGRGGMGSVWLAQRTDGRFEAEVAIKFLDAGLFSAAGTERFAREGSIMARLAHPHIARLLDAGHLATAGAGQPYLVLEHVPGLPIDAFCAAHDLPLPDRLHLVLDVLDAVAHAHNRLILHRDLKPSNILVTAAGEVKLLDFGIAKLLDAAANGMGDGALTQQAGNAFTPQYAAPEQLQGGEVSTATDVYALGVLLYRLLSGRLPLEGEAGNTLSHWHAVVERTPPLVSQAVLQEARQAGRTDSDAKRRARALQGDLDTIVAKALKKQPAERYANAAALADDLRRHLAHAPIAARPDTWAYRSAKFLRRHRVAVGAGTAAALALAGSAAVAVHEGRQAQRQQAQAEGLIEFLLGDLPAKLKPVGRLDALDAVGDRALAYYAAQSPGSLDAESLGRRARALHLMGEITEQAGRLDDAAQRFAEAAASTGELLARHPGQPQHVFNHAQSEYWVGFIARRRGLRDDAEAAFLRYQALAQQLTRIDPADLDWRTEVAYASQNLGVLQLEAGRADAALASFRQTQQAWQSVVPTRPAMAEDQANTLGWLSKAHEALHDFDAAIAAQRAKFEALARVPDAARNRGVQSHAGIAHYDIARLQAAQGQTDAAQASLESARTINQALVRLDPQNLDWRAVLAATLASTAELHAAGAGATTLAPRLAELQALVAPLLAAPQPKLRWWLHLQGRLLVLQARADAPGAAAALRSWLAEVDTFERGGQPPDAEQSRIAAAAGMALGDLLQRRGRPGDAGAAADAWQQAALRLQPGLQRRELPALALAAQLAWRRGAVQEARAHAEKLVATAYRPAELQALHDALARAGATAR
ncbi:protein kinase domain-containing protein [Rubrivivax sp. RP6-9]|uniref:serine/threonine-protein kinase n=1 Tax=Rubrivivax sp. RP6-9 TaxID=3415750 RepID=UPI003CC68C0D